MAKHPVVAPTIVRFSFTHAGSAGHPFISVVDLSLDEYVVSRGTAVNALVPDATRVWQENVCAFLQTNWTFVGARWLDLDSETGSGGFQTPIAGKPVNGGTAGAMLPPNVAMLIHKQCGHDRRQRNGRMYLPVVGDTDADSNGVIQSSAVSAWQTRMNNLRSGFNGIALPVVFTVAWRVVHVESHDSDGDANAWSSSDISSVLVDSRCATQRRRQR